VLDFTFARFDVMQYSKCIRATNKGNKMNQAYHKIKAQIERCEALLLIYTNEIGDSERIEQLKFDLETLNMQALELLNEIK
jgi:hypothetical protein